MTSFFLECVNCGRIVPYAPELFSCRSCNSEGTNLKIKGYRVQKPNIAEFRKTPCYKISELNYALGLDELYIKDETFSETGTMKDRRSKFLVRIAKENNYKHLFCVTVGNSGKSLSLHSKRHGMRCISQCPEDIPAKVKNEIKRHGELSQNNNFYETAWTKEKIRENYPKHLDCTANNPASFYPYAAIMKELAALKPDYVIAPFGTGELFCGLCQGAEEYSPNSKIIGAALKSKNIILSNSRPEEKKHEKFKIDRKFNKISGTYTPLLPIIMHYISKGNKLIELEKEEAEESNFEMQQHFDSHIEDSSLSVFLALKKLEISNPQKVVCVLTGKNRNFGILGHK